MRGRVSAQTPKRRRLLAAAAAGSFLAGVNMATIQVALPTIARHFDASPIAASWTLLSYLAVFTVMVLVLGRVADLIGHGRTYLVGLAVLTLASLLCGFAPNVGTLIALRSMQAVGAAAAFCTIAALVAAAVPRSGLPRAVAVNFAIGSLGQVLGPGLGGLLASTLGWRSVFWFNVPIGIGAMALALGAVSTASGSRTRERFDILGAVLAACLLGGLVVGVSEAGVLGVSHPLVVGCLVTFLLALGLLAWTGRRSEYPLVDPDLFVHSTRGPAYLSLFFLGASFYGLVAVTSLYLQAAGGLTAGETGLRVLTMALAMTIAMPVSGALTAKYSARAVTTAGSALVTIGVAGFAVTVDTSALFPVWLAAAGAGVGLFQASNTDQIMGSVRADRRAIANGARQATQNTGYTLSTALSLAIVASPLTGSEKRAVYAGSLHDLSGASADLFTHAFQVALVVMAALGLISTLVSWLRTTEDAASSLSTPVTGQGDSSITDVLPQQVP